MHTQRCCAHLMHSAHPNAPCTPAGTVHTQSTCFAHPKKPCTTNALCTHQCIVHTCRCCCTSNTLHTFMYLIHLMHFAHSVHTCGCCTHPKLFAHPNPPCTPRGGMHAPRALHTQKHIAHPEVLCQELRAAQMHAGALQGCYCSS